MTKTYQTYVTVRIAVEADSKADARAAAEDLIGEMRAALPTGCSVYDSEASRASGAVELA